MKYFKKIIASDPVRTRAGLLICAAIVANFFNFAYNAFLGRAVSLEDYAVISLLGSFLGLLDIPVNALSSAVTYKSAFLLGRFGKPAVSFWKNTKEKSLIAAVVTSLIWLASVPFLTGYFNLESPLPLLVFAPVWALSIISTVDGGFIRGNLRFGSIAVVSIAEALTRFFAIIIFVQAGLGEYAYAAFTFSALSVFILLYFFAGKTGGSHKKIPESHTKFPFKFFASSAITRASATIYLTFDILLAKHFLPADQAGQYALLSLTGKMVYFAGTLFSQFVLPIVSKKEGSGKDSGRTFLKLLFGTFAASFSAFLIIGALGSYTMPILFGENAASIIPFVFWYTLAMVAFTIATNIVSLHQIKNQQLLPVVSFLLAVMQIAAIYMFHGSVEAIAGVMVMLGFVSLTVTLLLHFIHSKFMAVLNNFLDLRDLFVKNGNVRIKAESGIKILILNWRDTKHIWAGGAEVYIHELAKRFVAEGNSVTVFCGNDAQNPRNQMIDGVKIIRRGGFYTVYIWAILYYVFKFRKKYDLIIDSENGIPFFTPLFSTKPIILLIHHVHQDIFMQQMKFPMSYLARFIEGKLMPFVYKNKAVVTVSESSKGEIIKTGIAESSNIQIINPGIEIKATRIKKSKTPTLIYVGRLKPYKNVDVALRAFARVVKNIKDARFLIVGEGESIESLKKLSRALNFGKNVKFYGKVSEKKKIKLLSEAWAAVQPSQVEGWGITVIEANACGTPVIASNVNGLKDSIVDKKTGILVRLGDERAFSRAIEKILTHNSYRKRISRNAAVWAKGFDWDRSAGEFYEVIEEQNEKAKSGRFLPGLTLQVFNRG